MKRALLLLAVVGSWACGPRTTTRPPSAQADAGATTTPDAGPEIPALARDLPELARRTVAMLEALATALEGAGDCDALAKAAGTVLTEHREVRVAAAAVDDRGDGRALDNALEAHADAIAAAAGRIQPAVDRCFGNAAFAEAMTPLDTP
jgi:hypothetical protein